VKYTVRKSVEPSKDRFILKGGRLLIMSEYDLIKGKVKSHYRKLPNGKIIWIKEHFDKRKKKKTDEDLRHKVIHADETSTTMVNSKNEPVTHKHEPYNELSEDDIHANLNSAMTVDEHLAMKMWMHKRGVKDVDQLLTDLVKDEKDQAEKSGRDPEFTNKKEALAHIMNAKQDKKGGGFMGIKQYAKTLQDKYGNVTTYAKAYLHPDSDDFKKYIDHTADNEDARDEDRSMARMTQEGSEKAQASAEKELEQVNKSQSMGPNDCPEIHGLSKTTQLFGHQAETLAKLNILPKAIVDVDMGGGKGLILPADALNLMGQGKVKRPLIVVPGATLAQNASKIHDYTDKGVNVFLISNSTINEHFEGDPEKMVEAIRKAPPNTIFMASYDVFSHKDKDAEEGDEFARAKTISGADFDYVALDEAHNIKNIETARFKSMKYLTKAKYKRVASGTFLSNNPTDTLGQMMFLHPQMSMSQKQFEKEYGRKETSEGVEWTGLKNLRDDLMKMGMISLRRSAWIDKLPEREENLSVVKMDNRLKAVHEAVLNDVIDQLEEEMSKNPRLKKFFDDDGIGEADELPPQALAKLSLVASIVDHPSEMAAMMEEKIERIKEQKESGEIDDETMAMMESLMKMKSETRSAIKSLRGVVSPKAKDVYEKIAEHLKDKKNGKYIVFVQRKASAAHIMNNMPEEMKGKAVYYDASKKAELDDFLKNPKGPQIIVAVDASIKEGVNMQVANGMYRYDHHWSPGNQEQSYARIWRFGQDKPTKFHMGVVDGSIDVPKYARLLSKLNQNMEVISDYTSPDDTPAFKMGLATLKSKNNADILPQYQSITKNILDYQKGENKELQKRYGKGMYKKSSGQAIGGKNAAIRHGLGAYHDDLQAEKVVALPDNVTDSLMGHFREQLAKEGGDELLYDQSMYDSFFMDSYKLTMLQRARNPEAKKLDPILLEQWITENNAGLAKEGKEPLSKKEIRLATNVAEKTLAGAKHKPHNAHSMDVPLKLQLKEHGYGKASPSAVKTAKEEVQVLIKKLGKNQLTHLGDGKVENPEIAAKAIAEMEKAAGEKFSPKYKKLLLGTAAMVQEVHGGWDSVKHEWEHIIDDFRNDDEDK